MNLLYLGNSVGSITELEYNQPEVSGTFVPNEKAEQFVEMWKFIVNEENYDRDPPFPSEMLNDESWSVETETGTIRPIFLPAVYEDNTIRWNWRD